MEANIKCDFSTTTPCQVAEVEVHEVAKPSSRRAGRWWRGGGSGDVGVGIWLLGNSPSLLWAASLKNHFFSLNTKESSKSRD